LRFRLDLSLYRSGRECGTGRSAGTDDETATTGGGGVGNVGARIE
jgi:hypothetical protein